MSIDTVLTFDNPVFHVYVLAAAIMILKLMLQPWMTVQRMMKVRAGFRVITSYSIHYTKLYEQMQIDGLVLVLPGGGINEGAKAGGFLDGAHGRECAVFRAYQKLYTIYRRIVCCVKHQFQRQRRVPWQQREIQGASKYTFIHRVVGQ